ncbi:hypothetical protein GIB67_010905 [Kingdonia uniflora]|uniref:Uncharacterized protein n=1 Tax=Kingdonia uniflora TaxID=39325 RepID=A0A7J7M4K6_9MAGN|nr:hypothetical protein GIB67_010905 [Kingdonia uniflora]
MQIHHNIDVTYNRAWHAKENARAKMRGNFKHAYQLLTSYFVEVRYGVAYSNHVESWNNVILKVRDLTIHVSIEELRRICSKMSYMYMEEAEKSQTRLTPWATDHCESRKFVADLLTRRWKNLKTDPRVRAPIPTVRAGCPRTQRKRREKMSGLVAKLRFCNRCRKNGQYRRSCKLLSISSYDNTRPTMAPSFTMSTEPPVIPDEDVAISLH